MMIANNAADTSNGGKSLSYKTMLNKTIFISLLIMGATIGTAHSELSIAEKNPQSSVINQYASLKNANPRSAELHQLVADLNQRVSINPKDALAWELLAQIYYNNGYHTYAVYAASEAIESGYSTAKIKKILLNSSAIVSKGQLQADYLAGEIDEDFLKEYQLALSKIYGEVHGFNYDESLPKPPVVRPRAVKAKSTSSSRSRPAASKKAYKAPVKQRAKPIKKRRVVKPKPAPVRRATPKPAPKSKSNSRPSDPFSIVR